ncbi:hypothetical protein RND71_025670 [Anisodus tanguticus]|uniref:isopentenyl-diphosphate Delta-isomerase n=1 Tax=Anisodus tanguticus TaxID=243964 RepID=A0AAE1RQG0_9SOLA|nr:hypothetical protein RND71_025670 [Anisodus tanguticus]
MAATKVTFPLVWTNTCCSHPLYRDSELIEENALGVRNVAQRKLLDELGISAEDVPVDQFTPLGRILYKAPSDGKWGEHERNNSILSFYPVYWFSCCLNFDAITCLPLAFDLTRSIEGVLTSTVFDYLLFMVREVNMKPNPDEVAEVKYVNREQLKELLRKADAGEEGLKLSPWFRLIVDNFLFKWWDHLEKGTLKEVTDMKTIHKLT